MEIPTEPDGVIRANAWQARFADVIRGFIRGAPAPSARGGVSAARGAPSGSAGMNILFVTSMRIGRHAGYAVYERANHDRAPRATGSAAFRQPGEWRQSGDVAV